MRVVPYIRVTIVPPTDPRQWYKGLGKTNRVSSGVWRWRQEPGSILEPKGPGTSSSSQQGEPHKYLPPHKRPPPPRRPGLGPSP